MVLAALTSAGTLSGCGRVLYPLIQRSMSSGRANSCSFACGRLGGAASGAVATATLEMASAHSQTTRGRMALPIHRPAQPPTRHEGHGRGGFVAAIASRAGNHPRQRRLTALNGGQTGFASSPRGSNRLKPSERRLSMMRRALLAFAAAPALLGAPGTAFALVP